MSIEAMALVLHHSRAKGATKLVLVGIANHDGDGGAWPTIETLARYANVSERAVQQAVSKLVRMGELHVWRNGGGTRDHPNNKRPNRYEVLVRCPIDCDGTKNHKQRGIPADLGRAPLPGLSTGAKPASPQSARGELSFTSRGEASFTQTIPSTPSPTVPKTVTVGGDCAVCSRPESVCRRLYSDDHAYTPLRSRGGGQP